MADIVDIRVVGLLCSRLCHELVNPLGAVNNGIELILDVGDDMRDEALALIESSARRATDRLQFYRMAYGAAGATALGDLAMVRALIDGLLAEGRVSIEWPQGDHNPSLAEGWGRMLLNLVVAASETLPRGGTLVVTVEQSAAGGCLTVVARGERATIEESVRPVYFEEPPVESLSARNVHGYFTSRLAESLGGGLDVSTPSPEEVRFELRLG